MKICVCSPDKETYSETFIRAHIERLPQTIAVYNDWPLWEHEGKPIVSLAVRFAIRYGGRVHGSLGKIARWAAVNALARFFKQNHINVVLAEYGYKAAELLEACSRSKTPLVAHFHGVDAYHRDVLAEHGNYRQVFAQAAAMIAVSRPMERQLLELGAPRERLFCNPCGVDLEVIPAIDVAANGPLFIAVGRFVDKKAPYITLMAFQRVLEACPEARLAYVGDGPLLEACRQIARALRIGPMVNFYGRLKHPDVVELIGTARAFVQHSLQTTYGDSEGTPVAVLEAAARALPVISTRHAGIPDAVLDGETGLLVDELDVDGMAAHMIALARDPVGAAAMGRRGRQHIERNYSMSNSIQSLLSILEQSARRPRI